MGSMYAIWTPVICCGVAFRAKVMRFMTANSATKSPKVETIWAYQSRRMGAMRSTAPMLKGSGGGGVENGRLSAAAAGMAVLAALMRHSLSSGPSCKK